MSHITADSAPAEVRKHWVAALESGAYAQAKHRLADGYGGYCCLGVACDLAVKAGVIDSFNPDHADLTDGYKPVMRWLGLSSGDGRYVAERDERFGAGRTAALASDNDRGDTFAEIAATIRAAPEDLFVD